MQLSKAKLAVARRRTIATVLAAILSVSLAASLLFVAPVQSEADDNPATEPLAQTCEADPALSELVQSGIAAATIGELVTWTQTVTLDQGNVYQDILVDPAGSIFYASYIEITQLYDTDPGSFLTLVGSPVFSIDGAPVTTIPGTGPDPVDFVLESATSAAGAPVWRVYFPGDEAQMLADQSGEGALSYTVGPGGEAFSLAFETVVDDDPVVEAGVVLDGASCYAQISSGPSNRNTDRPIAAVSIVEPTIELTKASDAPGGITGPDTVVTYEITATNPGTDTIGVLALSTAYAVVLVDTLPAGLAPVDASGALLADGASTASGAVYDAAANTLTWDTIGDVAPAAAVTVSYDAITDPDLAGGDELTNTVVADLWGLPDKDGRAYDDAATADETVIIGSAVPTLNKALSYSQMVDGAPTGVFVDDPAQIAGPLPINYEFTQIVSVELSSDSAFFNTTVHDVIPDGLTFVSFDTASCEVGAAGPGSCPAPLGQTLTPAELSSGTTPLLWFIGDVITGADPITYTFTYTVSIDETYSSATHVALDDVFTNNVDLHWNLVDRLGAGVVPTPGGLPPDWDGVLSDTTSVGHSRPVLSISKTDLVDPEPADLATQNGPVQWEIVITNSGTMDAVNIDVLDTSTPDLTGVSIASSSGPVAITPSGFLIPGPVAGGDSFSFIVETDVLGEEISTQVSVNTADISCYRDPFGPTALPEDSRPCYDDVVESGDAVNYLYPAASIDKTLVTLDPPQEQQNPFSSGYGGPIWFEIELQNDGEGSAWNPLLADTAPTGFCAADIGFLDVDGVTPLAGLSFSSTTTSTFEILGVPNLAPDDGAPGGADEFSFLYAITPCGPVIDGPLNDNVIELTYEDALGNTQLDGEPYEDEAIESFGVASPTLAMEKLTDSTGLFFDTDLNDEEYNIVTWTVVVENTSATQWAYAVEIADTVPAGLLADFGDAIPAVPQPSADAAMVDNSTSATDLLFEIVSLPPGGIATISIPTYQDGTIPPADVNGDYTLINTATVTSPNALCGAASECEDTAFTTLTVPWAPPTVQKTVADADEPLDASDDPDSSAGGVPGEDTLEYELIVDVPDNDPELTLDLWVKDVIPHGIEIDPASISISCTGPGCDAGAASLGLIATYPNQYQEYAFWLGDVGVGGATYTISYQAAVLLTFFDGTPVLGGATYSYDLDGELIEQLGATPFINQAELHYNAPALIGGSGDVITADPYAEDGDGDATTHGVQDGQTNDSATYDIETPLLVIEKAAERYRPDPGDLFSPPTAGAPIDWGLAFQNDGIPTNTVFDDNDTTWLASEVGDWFRYTIEVPNLGTNPAYNVTFGDDLTNDGAMVAAPGSIVTAIGASSDPGDPALATPQLAAAAAGAASGICTFNDGGTAGITRTLVADDTIDCFDNSGLAAGDSIFLTYWAQTQTSDELQSFGVAGPGIPGSASPDLIRNEATLVSYNAAPAAGGEIISGDTDFHEQVVFTPIAEVNYFPQNGICAGLGGVETPTGNQFTMSVNTENGHQRRETGDTPIYSSGSWAIRPAPSADYPADPAGFGIGYNQVITITLPPGVDYVAGTSNWTIDPRIGATQTLPLPEPTIIGTIATGLTLVYDSTDPAMGAVVPDQVDPVLFPTGFWLPNGWYTTPELLERLTFDIIVPDGDNWGQSWGSASLEYQDQLGNVARTGGDYQYTMTDPEGCGGQPGNSFTKTPDLPWINPSTGETYEQAQLNTDTEFEYFTLNFRMYVDQDQVWFVDYLPAEFTYAGDPTNPTTYLTDPTTTIPSSMFGNGGTDFVDDMQYVFPDAPNPGETTVMYGPFDLEITDDNVVGNGYANFQVRVPVRRTLPYDEDTSPGQYQNTAQIMVGPDIDNLTPTGLGDDGELEIPPPSGEPVVTKRITNWQPCDNDPSRACGLYGDTAQFEVVLELPKFFSGQDVVLGDFFHRLNSTAEPDFGPATNIVINCHESVVGGAECDHDDDGTADFDFSQSAAVPLAPGMQLPTVPSGPTAFDDAVNDGSFGWYLGDVDQAIDENARLIVITFDLPAPAPTDAGFYSNFAEANYAYLRYDDVNNGRWAQFWDGYDPVADEGPNNAFAVDNASHLQGWAEAVWYSHAGSTADSDVVNYRIGYPTVSFSKVCEPLDAIEAEWLTTSGHPALQATAAGVPNLSCVLTVRNSSPYFDALGVEVNESDDASNDVLTNDPFQNSSTATTDIEWQVTSITQGGALTTAPFAGATSGDLQDFAWTIDRLAAGEIVEIGFEVRVDHLGTPDPADPEGTMWWFNSNVATAEGFTDDPDQYVANLDRVDPFDQERSVSAFDFVQGTRPRVSVTKFPIDVLETVPTKNEDRRRHLPRRRPVRAYCPTARRLRPWQLLLGSIPSWIGIDRGCTVVLVWRWHRMVRRRRL